MRILIVFLMLMFSYQSSLLGLDLSKSEISSANIVTSTKRIFLPNYPGAYNPSIIKYKDQYLLTFRYLPNRYTFPWLSYIGVVLLDHSFEPISQSQLLDTRFIYGSTPSQSEDARVFSYNDRYYLIFNDNVESISPTPWDRRDMYMVELLNDDNQFYLSDMVKLMHESKYSKVLWQKNWTPFVWNNTLLFSYMLNPHEVLCPNLDTGICHPFHETYKGIDWNLGSLRGGSPAQLINGEYFAFFHSGIYTASSSSGSREMWHYYMGAYTFSANPPFEMTKITSAPIDAPGFYTYSSYDKRVIYPGGYVINGSKVYVAYGKDDSEIWIATIDYEELQKSMVPVSN